MESQSERALVSTANGAFLKAKGFTKAQLISKEEKGLPLALLVATIDKALEDKQKEFLLHLGALLRSMIEGGWPTSLRSLIEQFIGRIASGELPRQSLMKAQLLQLSYSPMNYFAEYLAKKNMRHGMVADDDRVIWSIIEDLRVSLTLFTLYQGNFSEKVFFCEGSSFGIAILKVISSHQVEFLCLTTKEPEPEKVVQFGLEEQSVTSEEYELETPDGFCKSCGTSEGDLFAKVVCKCLFCTLCNPRSDVCLECSTKENPCKLEERTKRYLRDFEGKCRNLCICKHCYEIHNLTSCKFCFPDQIEDKRQLIPSCFQCNKSADIFLDACERGCNLCRSCLSESIEGTGLCLNCEGPLSESVQDAF
mmetsp:Transcript_21984/g.40131  ORF Transcript_21984/g.40131 Transcript_21984/m.40131 type:complete len:364 (-) Transcript_21984:189-1280(-)